MGISYGGVASLTPAVAIQIFGLEDIGELLGFLLMSYGLAAVVGPPIAGMLVDRSGNYRDVIWFALIASLAGVVVSLLLRHAQPAPETEAREAAA
jgi:MFS family permease